MKIVRCASSVLVAGILLFVFLAYIWWMNTCFLFSSDDCVYALTNVPGKGGVPVPLASVSQVLGETIADGYRPIVHFFVRLFTGLFEKPIFDIANTLMMGCFLLLLYRLAKGTWRLAVAPMALLIVLVLFVLCKGESYLWCAGSLNYLWAATGTLAFYALVRKIEQSRISAAWTLVSMVIAVIAGALQESFSVPFAFALGVYSLIRIRALSRQKVLVYGCYGVGILVLVLTSMNRIAGTSVSMVALVGTMVKVSVAIKGVWLLCLLLCVRRDRIQIVRRNLLEMLTVVGSVLLICGVGFNGERSLWCANLFAILVIVRELKVPRWGSWILVCLPIPVYCVTAVLGFRIRQSFEMFDRLYMASPEGVTCHERVSCGPFSRFFHQAVYTWQRTTGHNRAYGHYRGRSLSPLALQRELYEGLYLEDKFCLPENRLSLGEYDFYTTPTANAFVMPINTMDVTDWDAVRVVFQYAPPDSFREWIRRELAARRMPPVSEPEHPVVLKTAHGDYLLIAKRPGCDGAIRKIEFQRRKPEARCYGQKAGS